MKILAFDISSSPGAAIIEIKNGKPKLIIADSVKTDKNTADSQRFAYIEAFAVKTIHEYGQFDAVVREHFTKGGSKRSTQLVFGAWAAIDMALGRYNYKVDSEISPTELKRVIGGKGTATKKEVEDGVRRLCAMPDSYRFKSDDASDAAAVALTYAINKKLIKAE